MTTERTWRKSSRSDPDGEGNCVEVAFAQLVHVRDSKNTAGGELGFTETVWRRFIGGIAP